MPKRWFNNFPPHTHKSVDDAIEQGLYNETISQLNKIHLMTGDFIHPVHGKILKAMSLMFALISNLIPEAL